MSLLYRGTAAALQRALTPEPERAPIGDPVEWTRDRLSITPWSIQRLIMRKLAETGDDAPRRLGVPACHGPGKTAMAAWIAAWWIDSASAPGKRKVISSAPTGTQVATLLWGEISKAHYAGGLPGRITGLSSEQPRWYIGDELVGMGRKPQDLVDPNQAMQAFQGMHAEEGVLVILDEATGIPGWLWSAALSLLTNAPSRILAIGNPDDPSSTFAEKTAPGSGWWVRHIDAFETPLFTGEPVSARAAASLVSPEWVRDAEQDYGGQDNPLYISKVRGQWPDVADDLVVQPRHIRTAFDLVLPGRARGSFGLDVARSPTGDESALYRNRGGVIRYVDSWKGLPITAETGRESVVTRMENHCLPLPGVPVVIDTDGLGIGAYDGAVAVGLKAVRFTASGPAHRADRFDSRRSELWWSAREALRLGEWDLDEADEVLAAQLQTPKWWIIRGRIHVETKDELSRRGKKSPDRADAAIIAAFGAPIDLRDLGELGAPAPRRPRRDAGGVPASMRVRTGETSGIKTRPM